MSSYQLKTLLEYSTHCKESVNVTNRSKCMGTAIANENIAKELLLPASTTEVMRKCTS